MPLDVPLTDDGDLPHYSAALLGAARTDDDRAALAVQRAKIRLRTFRGEVPSDAAAGIPYVEIASAAKATSAMRRAFSLLVRREIEAIDDVASVTLSDDLDADARALTLRADVVLDFGGRRGITISPLGVSGDPSPRIE